jgi:ribosomal protein L40E
MTGLKQRILGRRGAGASGAEDPPPADLHTDQAHGGGAAPIPPAAGEPAPAGIIPDDAPTIAHDSATVTAAAQAAPDATEEAAEQPVPAGAEPVSADRPGFSERGRMRRRLRYLRRAHELGLRDLGGLVFDLRRFRRQRFDLVEAKLHTLTAVDREMRALEHALNDRRPIAEIREAGISTCSRCGALTASDANYCAQCGLQLGDVPPAVAAPVPSATEGVSAADAGATPLSADAPAPVQRAPAPAPAPAPSAPGVTSGDPLAPPPTSR